ncbi:MAG: hypothetical protein C0471_02600 [Erythrobacter sp.]|nr:hypothetical protein [Erythrobacter sp.]
MAGEQVPADWAADVERYVPDADDGVIAKIIGYCGQLYWGRFDTEAPPPAAPAAPAAPVTEPAPVAPSEGAGIVSEVVEGRPRVSAYFAVGENDIVPEFAAAMAPVKAWLEVKPVDTSDEASDLAGARRVEITVSPG